jgi:hypothetical protein
MGSDNAQRCAQNADMASDLTFMEQYHKDGDEFLSHIITSDEP